MTATALRSVREFTTTGLAVNDTVIRAGRSLRVAYLEDTGRSAVFGTGNEWAVTLQDEAGRRTSLAAASSDRWQCA